MCGGMGRGQRAREHLLGAWQPHNVGTHQHLTHRPLEQLQLSSVKLLVQLLIDLVCAALSARVALYLEEQSIQSGRWRPSKPDFGVRASRGGRLVLVEDVSEHQVDGCILTVCHCLLAGSAQRGGDGAGTTVVPGAAGIHCQKSSDRGVLVVM